MRIGWYVIKEQMLSARKRFPDCSEKTSESVEICSACSMKMKLKLVITAIIFLLIMARLK